jgi:hypothetical protein
MSVRNGWVYCKTKFFLWFVVQIVHCSRTIQDVEKDREQLECIGANKGNVKWICHGERYTYEPTIALLSTYKRQMKI